jgi:predicted RNA-binding protein (TIGR00451 family)
LIATLRPKDGFIALTLQGAFILMNKMKNPPNTVVVQQDVSEFIRTGGDVFAKHIVRADARLRASEEVIVTDERGDLLGVGRAVLSGNDMQHFKRGVAVRVRKGYGELPNLNVEPRSQPDYHRDRDESDYQDHQ